MAKDFTFGASPEHLRRLLFAGLEDVESEKDPGSAVSATTSAEGPGTMIGRYRLLETIGEGGMGVVYRAEQQEPVRREVALKIIKPGMDSMRVLARFEAEQQALALMEHPHIARVYDAGLAPSGRPYFVMEHVKGIPITEHCDQYRLTVEQRLHLFLHVCEAIQHAHQKGIIHRDLKPSNLLVVIEDQEMIPKVIDFGVARAVSQPLTRRTLFTEQGQLIGTPAYMSPEQANPANQDIDTRTDIYSLGIVLYELLAGVLPFDPEAFRTGGIDHIRKVICEEDPKTPSMRLSKTSVEESSELARRRQTDVRILQRKLCGDLDWITLKALEKDRTRRYATVDALGADIRNYLNHQPVSAAPPGALYRAGKFARRHRQALTAAGGGVVLLIVLLWAVQSYVRAGALEHERILSEAQKLFDTRVMQSEGTSDPSSEALAMIEPLLTSRHVGQKAQLLYATILVEHRYYEDAGPRLEKLLNGRPEIAGAAYALLARIIWENPSLGPEEVKKAEEYQKKAEELLPETAEAYYLRAMAALTIHEKLDLLAEALALDSGHYPSRRLRALTYQASRKYEELRDDALIIMDRWPKDPLGHSLRATALTELGDYEGAITCYDDAIKLTPRDDPQYIEVNARRCEVLMRLGRYERVLTDAQECLKIVPDATVVQSHVFCALTALGRYEEASALFRRVAASNPVAGTRLKDWSGQYVFDAMVAGRPWHPAGNKPEGPAFLSMLEAEEMHRNLPAKAHRLIPDGFTGRWSPDGTKVVFSLGVHGYSGVAVYDCKTHQTDLLIIPGYDPSWSPDGRHIAFVRDCKVLRLSEFTGAERRYQPRPNRDNEVWVMKADGTELRCLASRGQWPSWSADGKLVYGYAYNASYVCSISVDDKQAMPALIMTGSFGSFAASPDGKYVAHMEGSSLQIRDLASKTSVAEWVTPLNIWPCDWSRDGREVSLVRQLSMASVAKQRDRVGLWIYDFGKKEPVKVLRGQIGTACRSPDRKQLLFGVDAPYYDIWVADLDPGLSTAEALGLAQTPEEHCRECIAAWNRELATDPNVIGRQWERAVLALWISDSNAPLYLQELDRAVDHWPNPASISFFNAWAILSSSPAIRDRLNPLTLLLTRKATEKDPCYARPLAALFQAAGQPEEAARLWKMAPTDTNYLVNGGFEDGVLAPWLKYGDMTMAVVTELVGAAVPEKPVEGKYCLYVDVAPGAANYWYDKVASVGAVFQAGKKYTVSAFLKAKKGTVNVNFKPQGGRLRLGWPEYGAHMITITDTWAEYHVTTPVFNKDVIPASFEFQVSAAPGGFWIDDVRFYEGDYVPTVTEK